MGGEGERPRVARLLIKAADQGFITYEELLTVFPQAEEDVLELDDFLAKLMETGIEVYMSDELAERDEDGGESNKANGGNSRGGYFDAVAMDDTVSLYFQEIGRVPLLTAEQEITLAKRMEAGRMAQDTLGQNGDLGSDERAVLKEAVQDGLAAREHLIRANSRLVISIAKKYIGRGVPFLDLVQEGSIGLIRTADKFNYRLGNKFSTYATWWIRQGVTRAIADQSRTIRLPVHMGDQLNRLLRTAHWLKQDLKRDPTSEELAAALEIPTRKVEQMLKIARRPLSLERPTDEEGDSELGDFIEDEDGLAPDDEAASALLRELLNEILQDLPPREARILQLRYGLVDGETHTLEEVGRKLGVTRERIRQIEAQALRRLRHPRRSRRLKGFLNR